MSNAVDGCGAQLLGVKRIGPKSTNRIVSTVRLRVDPNDGESVRLGRAEGEMKAKEQLLRDSSGHRAIEGTLKGVVLRDSWIAGRYLYVSVEVSEASRRGSRNIKRQIDDSLSRSPTPTAR